MSRYQVVKSSNLEKDPNKGVFTDFSRADVTVLDTVTGKTASATGHAVHGTGSVERATKEAVDHAVQKLK